MPSLNRDIFSQQETRAFPDGDRVVDDPYGGLRDLTSEASRDWVERQNNLTLACLPVPEMSAFTSAIEAENLCQPDNFIPIPCMTSGDPRYYFYKSTGSDSYGLFSSTKPVLDDEAVKLFDPLMHADEGLKPDAQAYQPNPNGMITVLERVDSTDFCQPYIYEKGSDHLSPDKLRPVFTAEKFISEPGGSGAYYMGYSQSATWEYIRGNQISEPEALYFHSYADKDDNGDENLMTFAGLASYFDAIDGPDGRQQLLGQYDFKSGMFGWSILPTRVGKIEDMEPIVPLTRKMPTLISIDSNRAVGITSEPDGTKIIAIPRGGVSPAKWETMHKFSPDICTEASLVSWVDGKVCLGLRKGFRYSLKFMSDEGDSLADITLADGDFVRSVKPSQEGGFLVILGSSVHGEKLLRFNPESLESPQVIAQTPTRILNMETVISEVTARDGAKIPIMTHSPKGSNRETPTLIDVYGGFGNIPYMGADKVWIEAGGRAVSAFVRGDMNGMDWAIAGRKEGRLKSSSDIQDVAEDLINRQVVDAGRIGLMGCSNGALVAANAVIDRPELFGAAVLERPIADMLHYKTAPHTHTWMTEYGDPDDPEDMDSITSYSPILRGDEKNLPPTLVIVADDDSRVEPWHGHELAAALQDMQTGDEPISLLRSSGGHIVRFDSDTVFDEAAQLGFMANHLGLDIQSDD